MYGEQDADWREDFRTLVAAFVQHSPTVASWGEPTAIVREAADWADLMGDERRRRRGLTAVGLALAQPTSETPPGARATVPPDRVTLPDVKAPPKRAL